MKSKPRTLYLPEGMPIPPDDIKDAAQFIVHRIYVGRYLWHSRSGAMEGTDYTHLMAAYLREEFPNYREARSWLLDNGVIESDGLCYDGKATGYRLKGNPAIIRVKASETVSRKINARQRENLRHYTKAHRHLARWLRRFEIEGDRARAFISTLHVRNARSPLTDDQFRQLCLDSVRMLEDGEWEHTVCNYGRFHSPYTRLLRELRQFVTVDGMGLVNIDIANSQPLMLGLLILEDYPWIREDLSRVAVSKEIPWDLRASGAPWNPSDPQPLWVPFLHDVEGEAKTAVTIAPANTNSISHPTENRDAEQYLQLCESGKLYEHLMELNNYSDRSLLKRHFFERVIFSTGKRDYEMAKVFRKHFPSVWETIVKAKQNGYQRLPQKMQRAESRVMIDTVCFRLSEEYPDIPIITIHDSIMTIREHVETVKRLMREAYAQVGLKPTIKEETLYADKNEENEPGEATATFGDSWGHDVRSGRGEIQMVEGV